MTLGTIGWQDLTVHPRHSTCGLIGNVTSNH
jgi:hypothetical protein